MKHTKKKIKIQIFFLPRWRLTRCQIINIWFRCITTWSSISITSWRITYNCIKFSSAYLIFKNKRISFFLFLLPGLRLTQRFPVSVLSLCCSVSLFFLRWWWGKIGAEFLFDLDWVDNWLSSSSSSSSDEDCRWRLNVLVFEIFSLRLRRLILFDTWRDNDDIRFLLSSWSSFKSDSGSIRRLWLLIERVSSALDFAWRVVVVACSSSRIKKKEIFYNKNKMKKKEITLKIRFVCRWFTFGTIFLNKNQKMLF